MEGHFLSLVENKINTIERKNEKVNICRQNLKSKIAPSETTPKRFEMAIHDVSKF